MAGKAEAKPGRILVFRLPYEGDLLTSIREAVEQAGVETGVFWIIGAVKKAHISFYNQAGKEYLRREFDRPMEILACTGNVAKLKGETLIHAHLVLGDEEGKAFGGHLEKGTIIFSAEMFLVELEGLTLTREYDEVTGLNLFKL